MKVSVLTLEAESAGEVELNDAIFALEPRADILHRVVRWQRAKKQAGTHKVKTRSETHGDRNAPIFRSGGIYKGPVVRSHAHDLPKKIRRLGLKLALSAKQKQGRLLVIDNLKIKNSKTGELVKIVKNHKWKKALLIDEAPDQEFKQAAQNIKTLNVLPACGANVYDILCHDQLVISKAAVKALEERLS